MSDVAKTFLTIFGAIIGLAIISVIISKKSRAPEAIGAISNGLARVVAAAVSPQSAATNGDLGTSTFSTPMGQINSIVQSLPFPGLSVP